MCGVHKNTGGHDCMKVLMLPTKPYLFNLAVILQIWWCVLQYPLPGALGSVGGPAHPPNCGGVCGVGAWARDTRTLDTHALLAFLI